VKQVRLLRQSVVFLPTLATDPATPVVRDCEGVLGPLLDSAGATGVLLRPDRYVLAYLPQGTRAADLVSQLSSIFDH